MLMSALSDYPSHSPHPIMMKCLYLMLTRERGHWTWRNKYRPNKVDIRYISKEPEVEGEEGMSEPETF